MDRIPEGWPRTEEELRKRLAEERQKPRPLRAITRDEYIALVELASFECPKHWDYRDCGGGDCPRKPDPCKKCPISESIEWSRKNNPQEKFNEIFDRLVKECENCIVERAYFEEPTYYEECMKRRHAGLKLYLIQQGDIVIVATEDSWEVPLV